MVNQFFEAPILNSPYEYPSRHWELDDDGQPTQRIIESRRGAEFVTPIPKPRRRRRTSGSQARLEIDEGRGLSSADQEYDLTAYVGEIRRRVDAWRQLPNPGDWGVTHETQRLLQHWRSHEFSDYRPFFCQVEAVETAIWLTEVAPKLGPTGRRILEHIENANSEANPELLRIALKMATSAGKTTVMAMIIAWQTINAVRHPNSRRFTRGFLVVAPGVTIRDRLRVLQPNDPDSYYVSRELVPRDMLGDLDRAKIVITNYHAFMLRERMSVSRGGRRLLEGRQGESLNTLETEGQMLQRVMPDLMSMKNILVLNDEGHHCYREKQSKDDEGTLRGDDLAEGKKNSEAARVWITGLETVKSKIGVRQVIDLSATPFFLRGSGYAEGSLFPWTVSDFSLMDAIECGIVKLPRVPVSDNIPGSDMPMFRNLWEHIGNDLPRAGRRNAGPLDPLRLPTPLLTALDALYGHYETVFNDWKEAGIPVPPCFIVVCNNTSTSKLVYDYISGFTRENEAGSTVVPGHFELFRNFDEYGNPLAIPRTLLIDSEQIESGDALDRNFRQMAADEIDRFRREIVERTGDRSQAEKITDQELLREVMNTVGKEGRLGGQVRCVVSVSMLTEGWDANTVTHVLGVRAFGTQLLCEQVVGRALRRQSYDLNECGKFEAEYADVLGIPFDFTARPTVVKTHEVRPTIEVKAVRPERDELEIVFPRIASYRVDLPKEELSADFNADSTLELTPELIGATRTRNEAIIGEGVNLDLEHTSSMRTATLAYKLTKRLLETRWSDANQDPKANLFLPLKKITRQWLDDCLVCRGNTYPAQLEYLELADMACEKIAAAITREHTKKGTIRALLDPFTPSGSTKFVNFRTSRESRWRTDARKCHVNWVVLDSDWEAELCHVVESHPKVRAYVKNHNLGLEVPYKFGSVSRTYIPDFIVHVDDGHEDPLNLVVEIKGYRREDAKEKKSTMETYWIPGVNNLGEYGRWAFAEFRDNYQIEAEFNSLISQTIAQSQGNGLPSYEGLDFKEMLADAPLEGIDLARPRDYPRDIDF